MRILLLDNYDSFTWNLHHQLVLHAQVDVVRNDAITVEEAARYDRIVLSPGPGLPNEAGIMMDVLTKLMPTHPILGCLPRHARHGAGLRWHALQPGARHARCCGAMHTGRTARSAFRGLAINLRGRPLSQLGRGANHLAC